MNKIEIGDCREIMKKWSQESVKAQTCVTSPPYFGLRDYGHKGQIGLEQTPEEYIDAMVEVFRCVRDVLADDGTLWLNIGDSYYNYRPGKGQALAKQSVSKTGQDLPQTCARRGNKLEGLKEKDLIGIPWMLAFALRADGWYLRQDIIWHKPNPMPESVRDRCTKAHEYIFLLSKSPKYYYDYEAVKETAVGGASGNKVRTDATIRSPHFKKGTVASGVPWEGKEKRNRRSVWTVNLKPYKGAHFATFPPTLIEPCVLAGSRENDIVLDPFMGSGTTAAVALQNNRQYLGCELNSDYADLQKQRIKSVDTQKELDFEY